jgi:transcriptional regulator with XRE-family HTH domain
VPVMGARALHRPAYREFCAMLRAWRLAAGLSQRDVGEKLGKPHSFVHKSEIGERRIDPLEFIELCHALGRDPAETLWSLDKKRTKPAPRVKRDRIK